MHNYIFDASCGVISFIEIGPHEPFLASSRLE